MPNEEIIHDPFTSLASGLVQMHELFLNLIAGGFTENQAIKILIGLVQNNQSQ